MRKVYSSAAFVPLLLMVASGTGLAQWNGEIVGWGNNDEGQCDFPENFGYVAIASGGYCVLEDPPVYPPLWSVNHSLGLKEDGSIVAVGNNDFGQCDVPEPNEGFVAVAAGFSHCLGLKEDGSIVAWGSNSGGCCDVPEPNEGFVAVAAGGGFIDGGYSHSLGLKEDGSIVAWGSNYWGQCDVPEPNEGFVAVAAGSFHSLGLKEDGSIVAWGDNFSGQCDVPEPNTGFVTIEAGRGYSAQSMGPIVWCSLSAGVKGDGSIVVWENNYHGQCQVPEPNSGFVAVAVGSFHSLGLKEDGSIVAWGSNSMGQCDVPEPNSGFVAIAAGVGHSLGLREISTGVEDEGLTGSFIQIRSVAPNPFPATTTITIALPAPGPVQLDVFDLAGRHVSTLLNHNLPAGNHTAAFDGSELPPGVYLVRLTSGSECATAKVVLVR